jgi:hypothetical protein
MQYYTGSYENACRERYIAGQGFGSFKDTLS